MKLVIDNTRNTATHFIDTVDLANLFGLPHRTMAKEMALSLCASGEIPKGTIPASDEQGQPQDILVVTPEDAASLLLQFAEKDGAGYWIAHDALSKLIAHYILSRPDFEVIA